MTLTYTLVYDVKHQLVGITCAACGLTSYHPRDVEEKYCGHCHRFHGTEPRPFHLEEVAP